MVIILAAFGIAAILFGVAFFVRCGFMATCLLTLATGTVLGAPFFQVSLITLDRLLVGGLVVAYFFTRKTNYIEQKPLTNWDFFFAAFLGALVVCTFTHDWKLQGLMPASRLIFYYFLPAMMYWFARQACVTKQTLIRMFFAMVGFGLYISITAIFEWRQVHAFVFPRYIVSEEYFEFLGRGRGPLLNPVGNGVLMCLCLGALLMLWPHVRPIGKSAIVVATLIFSIGVFSTLTRCVWIGFLLSGLLILMTAFPKRLRFPTIVAAGLLLVVVVAANWNRINSFKRDKGVSATEMSQSSELRPVLAYIAWQMFLDHPLSGVGLGQYKEHDKYYMSDRTTDLVLESGRPYVQHNTFLSLLTETGLLGAGLFVVNLLIWSRAAWALWSKKTFPLAARQTGLLFLILMVSYVVNSLFHDMSLIPMMHMVLFFFAGLTMGQYVKYAAIQKMNTNPPMFVRGQVPAAR